MRLTVPALGDEEAAAVAAVLRTGFLTQGPVAKAFEESVAAFTGTKRAIATSSCTTALHVSLVALGIGPGDEVIVPDLTFPATANVVVQQGATPVIVDIDPETYNMDPGALASAVTERTAAVIPVHAFGLCADMDPINSIASSVGVPVIEDAACALGGQYKGRSAGSLGDVGCFSFHPRKIITTGEGGMVTTDNDDLAAKLAELCTHGGLRGELYLEFVSAGFNYRLSDINAAVGLVQMGKLLDLLEQRRHLAAVYDSLLVDLEGVSTPKVPLETTHTYQSYVVSLAPWIDRDQVIRGLRSREIESTLGTYSLTSQPFFRDRFPNSGENCVHGRQAFRQTLTLPLYPGLGANDLGDVAEHLGMCIAEQT